ncbi:hypothetical protein SAY87_021786 [Trapa incisa]|uniref:RRM domain-containing protein n=1 Tax=Trapa incisa TaxID=236973 RepID=A0AAN7PSQ3_9MYRT|nr:hypothetical protein SAY87_021786 [Trapa incisa]
MVVYEKVYLANEFILYQVLRLLLAAQGYDDEARFRWKLVSQSELERLFSRYGRVERVDMKSGKLLMDHVVPKKHDFLAKSEFVAIY